MSTRDRRRGRNPHYSNTNRNHNVKISRTSEVEAEKRPGHSGRQYRPKVRIDGGCYTMSTRNRRRGAEPPAEPP